MLNNKNILKNKIIDSKNFTNLESQEINKTWWQNNPMIYDFSSHLKNKKNSKNFFEEIDERFFKASSKFLNDKKIPFDTLINYEELKNKNVLEIGMGAGTHASLLAKSCLSYTGIDLTENSIAFCNKRFRIFNLKGNLLLMDAEKTNFENNSFEFIWTWGVIHHSSNTNKILDEIHRVLKPNGKAGIMVYHRSFLYYYVINFIKSLFNGNFLKYFSIHKINQAHTDGGIARFYSRNEWHKTLNKFKIIDSKIFGQHTDLIPLPRGRLKNFLSILIPNFVMRFINTNLKQGYMIYTLIKKKK